MDSINNDYKSDVKGKLYRLIFKMNENIRITVKTPVGLTESEYTNMGQGTSDGAVIRAKNLDKGVKEYFNEDDTMEEITTQNTKNENVYVDMYICYMFPFQPLVQEH